MTLQTFLDVSPAETGFLDNVSYDSISLGPGYDRPYQFNPNVREAKSIQLYKHLNLKSCIWTFDAYYDMTELIDVCGGSVTADFQVGRSIEAEMHIVKRILILLHQNLFEKTVLSVQYLFILTYFELLEVFFFIIIMLLSGLFFKELLHAYLDSGFSTNKNLPAYNLCLSL